MTNGSLKLAFLCNDSPKWSVFILERSFYMANIFADGEKLLTKSDISSLQSAVAGKVKTVNNVAPDDKGNITIPAPDLSGVETKLDAKSVHDNLSKKVNDNIAAIKKNSNDIATKANATDVYTKAELDPKLAEAGKVKTVNNIEPVDGNITIPAPDLSGLETKADRSEVISLQTQVDFLDDQVKSVVTKLSDGTLAKVAHFKASEEQKAVDWSKDDGKGGLPKIGIIDG